MKTVLILLIILLVLYLLLVAPKMIHRADRSSFLKNRFYAHRGLFDNESDAPENSLAAFRKAMDAGYGMEMDVQLTKDNKLVVYYEDLETVYLSTDISMDSLSKELQLEILKKKYFESEEELYNFLESYSSSYYNFK